VTEIYKPYGMVTLSSELVREAVEWKRIWEPLQQQAMKDLKYAFEQNELDRQYGPRFGPDRGHLYEIRKQRRFEQRGQRLLAQLNGRPGRLRRAS
jgi:hypothetical protein